MPTHNVLRRVNQIMKKVIKGNKHYNISSEMPSQHFSNTLNGRNVIDYQMIFNLNCEAFEFDIALKVAADITRQYLLHTYISF